MNNKFDELTKAMAQSVTRRQALKKFGVGLAGMTLAAFGLANKAEASGGNMCCFYSCTGGFTYAVCVTPRSRCPAPQASDCFFAGNTKVKNCTTCFS
jgi:hypothetical protein